MSKTLSNRAKKRMILKAKWLNHTGSFNEAINILSDVIKAEKKDIGFRPKKLKSKSFVEVPPRVQCTKSNEVNYLKGDYYYSELGCVFLRKQAS